MKWKYKVPKSTWNYLGSKNTNKWNWNTYAVIYIKMCYQCTFYRIRTLFPGDVRHSVMRVWNHSHVCQGTINTSLMHQDILVSITHGQLGTTETELTKWMLYKMMDAIHNRHHTPLTPLCQKCIKFIYEVLDNSILWNMKTISSKYLLHK